MSISIKRHELRHYQTAELAPRLPGWTDVGDRGLLRREGFILQRLSLYRFSNWKGFRIHWSLQLTIVPDENLHSTIGGTLHHWTPRWPKLPWLGRQWRELWVKWEERLKWSERIIALAQEQVEPSISEPLTLQRAADAVARQASSAPENVYIAWSAAIATALLGRREGARDQLVGLHARLSAWLVKAVRNTPERVSAHDHETLRRLSEAIDALTSADAFAQYCHRTSRATEAAIGIPSRPLPTAPLGG